MIELLPIIHYFIIIYSYNLLSFLLYIAFGNDNKYRQLPCRTFIMTGCCPYKDRCQFLHDLRVRARDAKARIRAKNQEEIIPDAHFWPVMDYNLVNRKLDMKNQPTVSQNYEVPVPQNDEYRRHDEAVYSMWNHFVEYCTLLLSIEPSGCYCLTMDQMAFLDEYNDINLFTGNQRLSVLLKLSQGFDIETILGEERKQYAQNLSSEYQAKTNIEAKNIAGGLNSYVDSSNSTSKVSSKLRATAPEFKLSPTSTPHRHSPVTVPGTPTTTTCTNTMDALTTMDAVAVDSDDDCDIAEIANGLMKSTFTAISSDDKKSGDNRNDSNVSPFSVADILSFSPTTTPLKLIDPQVAHKEYERLQILNKINQLQQQLCVLDNEKSPVVPENDAVDTNQDPKFINFYDKNRSVFGCH